MKLNYLNLTSGRGRVANVALFELKKKRKEKKGVKSGLQTDQSNRFDTK